MKNVVIFINGEFDFQELRSIVFSTLEERDALYVLYQLPRVKLEAIPLIGDLKEIRFQKARRKISEWFDSFGLANTSCYPLVYEKRIGIKQLKDDLPKANELTVIGSESQEEFLYQLFKPLTKELEVQYVIERGDEGEELNIVTQ